jgi:hypothetical protein
MKEYIYQLRFSPDVAKINADILASSMFVKDLHGCKWNGNDKILSLEFGTELDQASKQLLDCIVEGLPRGHFVFAPSVGNRWQQHYGYVSFGSELQIVPTRIEVSNSLFNGLSSLLIDEILKGGFRFSVASTGSGDNLGAIEVSFDWEAKT